MTKLPKEELERVLKESYRTLISIKNKKKGGKRNPADEDNDKKENLKKKYARFT